MPEAEKLKAKFKSSVDKAPLFFNVLDRKNIRQMPVSMFSHFLLQYLTNAKTLISS
jgi:hypothetical protein